jgi:tetratricopeptide (TPR) repeat protein
MERWLRIVWPIALLALFGIVARGLPQQARADEPAACSNGDFAPRPQSSSANSYNAETLERCLAVQPDDVETMKDLGLMYESATKWDRAEAVYRRALAIDPEDGDTRVRLGGLLLRRGDLAGARREAEAALKVQPGSVAALQLFHRASGVEKGVR